MSPLATHSTEYLITERRERIGTMKMENIFDLLLIPSASGLPSKRLTVSSQDWQTFTVGDTVGYEAGKLWHKEVPDQHVEVEELQSTEANKLPPSKPHVTERLISITFTYVNGKRETMRIGESEVRSFLASLRRRN